MPIYEYQCQSCGEQTEILEKVNTPPTTECPHCQANTLRRLVSAPSFHLKGSGWYATDFKDKKPEKTKADAHSTSSKDTKKADTKEKKTNPNKTTKTE